MAGSVTKHFRERLKSEWNGISNLEPRTQTTGREGKLGPKHSEVGRCREREDGSLKESCGPCPGPRNPEVVLSVSGLLIGERKS